MAISPSKKPDYLFDSDVAKVGRLDIGQLFSNALGIQLSNELTVCRYYIQFSVTPLPGFPEWTATSAGVPQLRGGRLLLGLAGSYYPEIYLDRQETVIGALQIRVQSPGSIQSLNEGDALVYLNSSKFADREVDEMRWECPDNCIVSWGISVIYHYYRSHGLWEWYTP